MRKSKARRDVHLWRDPKYMCSALGVPLCSCCHKRPRMLTHINYPHLCKKCYDTRIFKKEDEIAKLMLHDGETLQRQWLAMNRIERENVLTKLRGGDKAAAALRLRIQNLNLRTTDQQTLHPAIVRLLGK